MTAKRQVMDLSLDDYIAKEGISSLVPKKGPKMDGSLSNVVFKVDNNGKRKADEALFEATSSAKGSNYGPDCGQVFVENLKYEVNDDDIQQLFSAFGPLKRAAVNYQKDGRSAGTAFVVFNNKADAMVAAESLQGVTLDGRELQLTFIDSSSSSSLRNGGDFNSRVKRQTKEFKGGNKQMWSDIAKEYDNAPKETTGKGWHNKWNKVKDEDKTHLNAEDLDADLDSYLAQRNNKL